MTKWRRRDSDNDAGTVKGRSTNVQDGTPDCAVVLEELGQFPVLSDDHAKCHLTLMDRKVCEEDRVLKTGKREKEVSVVLLVGGSGDSPSVVSCNVAQSVGQECLQVEEGACGKGEDPGDEVFVTEADMATSLAVSDAEETDRSVLSLPSIVLDLTQTGHKPPNSPEVIVSDAGPNRTTKLQLQLSTSSSQSPARKSPVTVQEWVDSLPLHHRTEEEGGEVAPLEESDDHLDLGLGAEAGLLYTALPAVTVVSPAEPLSDTDPVSKVTTTSHLARESSVQSDVTSHTGSHCSSVESYLESRRPDPEEVLLALGFGGPAGGASGVDTEVSRIPRRFLQPSKVKGIAIDSFLRYQQDLIETFESGFCGYRGLTGPSHTAPSEIVAKIMEKLRERDNAPPASLASAPANANNGASTPSVPTACSKFSRAARHVLTRTTVLGALPFIARHKEQQQSVLTPDNRRFLDSQGSKSPEIPRKRMIIGHRSYTFDCDGGLIEIEPVAPTPTASNFTPKPKPLLHKDSLLSTTTSHSFTSIDSDSDTDDHGTAYAVQSGHSIVLDSSTASFPRSTHFPSTNLSQDSPFHKLLTQKIHPIYPLTNKRMSSTSISSWESDGVISPILPYPDISFDVRHQSTEEHAEEEQNGGGLAVIPKHYNHFHSSPDSPRSVFWPMRYESIEEDVEVKSDMSAGPLSTSASEQSQDVHCETDAGQQAQLQGGNEERHTYMDDGYTTESKNRVSDVGCLSGGVLGLTAHSNSDVSNLSAPTDAQKSIKTREEQIEIQKEVISLLQIRRGSLKRQQRVLDDEEHTEVSATNNTEIMKEHECISGMVHEEVQSLALESDVEESAQGRTHDTEQECVQDSDVSVDDTSHSENSRIQDDRSHRIQCVRNEEEDPMQEPLKCEMLQKGSTGLCVRVEELSGNLDVTTEQAEDEVQLKCGQPQNRDVLQVASADTGGDSFEMEEICTCGEEEGRMTALSRAWSDSSGFLDGECDTYFPKQNGHSVEGTLTNSESSQRGVTVTNSETVPDGNPSCTSSDTPQNDNDTVVSANVGDDKSEATDCHGDFNVTSSTTECVQRGEIGQGAINQFNLPNNLFEELSNVNGWLHQCKVPCGVQPVCDVDSSRAELHQRSLLENINIGPSEGRNNSVTNIGNPEEATAHSLPSSNKTVTCGKCAILPSVHNVTCAYQDSLVRNRIHPDQPPHSTDDDSESTRHRTMSLHSVDLTNSLLFGTVRRVRSAPHCLEHLSSCDMYCASWSSASNMFSFCSDESVINVGLQKAGLGRTGDRRPGDTCAGSLCKPEAVNLCDSGPNDADANSRRHVTDTTRRAAQCLKPCVTTCGRNTTARISDAAVTGLQQLIGELADRGWDITKGMDASHFACHTEQQLLRVQGDAVRAGLAAYGRQLVGGQGSERSGDLEIPEANKDLQTIREVRDRIAAELRHIADLLEEQPPQRAGSITGQMAALLREQTCLYQQLEALNFDSSPSIYVEPASCCSVRDAVREENRQLQNIVERNSQELKEIRQLLMELVSVKDTQH